MKPELKKGKDKLARLEKNCNEVFKTVEKLVEAYKDLHAILTLKHQGICDLEIQLSDDIRQLYSEEDFPCAAALVSAGKQPTCPMDITLDSMAYYGMQYCNGSNDEVAKTLPLVEALRTNMTRVHNEYSQIFNTFKKRFAESNNSDAEAQALEEDLETWEEQKMDNFDNILLLLKEIRKGITYSTMSKDTLATTSSTQDCDPEEVLTTCEALINNNYGASYFKTYLEKEFSAENLDFWQAVNKFRTLTDDDMIKKYAKKIYNMYFTPNSEKEINISSTLANKLNEAIANPTIDMFDETHKAIYELMQSDSFPRFKKDPLYQKLIRRLQRKDFVNYRRVLGLRSKLNNEKKPEDYFSERDWLLLLSGAEAITVNRGDVIIQKDSDCRYLFKIKNGKIKLENEQKETIRILSDGDVFGLTEFTGFRATCNYVVEARAMMLRVEDKVINALLQVSPQFSERFFQMLCVKLANTLYGLPIRAAISKQNDKNNNDSEEPDNIAESEQIGIDELKKDIKMAELFMLRKDDVIIKEYNCALQKTLKMNGKLYLFGKHIAFYSKVFGNVTKIVEPLGDIAGIERRGHKKLVFSTVKKQKYTFCFNTSGAEVYSFMSTVWKPSLQPTQQIANDFGRLRSKSYAAAEESLNSELSQEGWELVFKCAKRITYKKDQVILKQGELARRIYQIGSGSCRVELSDKKIVLGKMKSGEIFGEITYMYGGGATVSLVAEENDVTIYSIDKTSLQDLFASKPEIAAKLNKFLASLIGKRLIPKVPKTASPATLRKATKEEAPMRKKSPITLSDWPQMNAIPTSPQPIKRSISSAVIQRKRDKGSPEKNEDNVSHWRKGCYTSEEQKTLDEQDPNWMRLAKERRVHRVRSIGSALEEDRIVK